MRASPAERRAGRGRALDRIRARRPGGPAPLHRRERLRAGRGGRPHGRELSRLVLLGSSARRSSDGSSGGQSFASRVRLASRWRAKPTPGQDKADEEHDRRRGNERASREALRPVVQEHLVLTRGQYHAACEPVGLSTRCGTPSTRARQPGSNASETTRIAGCVQAVRRRSVAELSLRRRRRCGADLPVSFGTGPSTTGSSPDRTAPVLSRARADSWSGTGAALRREVGTRQVLRVLDQRGVAEARRQPVARRPCDAGDRFQGLRVARGEREVAHVQDVDHAVRPVEDLQAPRTRAPRHRVVPCEGPPYRRLMRPL